MTDLANSAYKSITLHHNGERWELNLPPAGGGGINYKEKRSIWDMFGFRKNKEKLNSLAYKINALELKIKRLTSSHQLLDLIVSNFCNYTLSYSGSATDIKQFKSKGYEMIGSIDEGETVVFIKKKK